MKSEKNTDAFAAVTDNVPEFIGKALDAWAKKGGVKLHFIDPRKPARNC
jgi:hypothetical protein